MRTDSTRVADEALVAVRDALADTYGEDYVPEQPNRYTQRQGRAGGARGHPPHLPRPRPRVGEAFLAKDELALYKLIWNRFVASQMRPAVYDETAVEITAGAYLLRVRGSVLKFKGFLAVYEESPDEKVREEAGPRSRAPRRRRPRAGAGGRGPAAARWPRATC